MISKLNISVVLLLMCLTTMFGAEVHQGIYDDYDTGLNYKSFDDIMNEVRFETADDVKVSNRIDELELMIQRFPTYPHLSISLYFLGAHHKQSNNNSDAIDAFERALLLNPNLGLRTPILKYLSTVKEELFKRTISYTALLILLLIFTLCISIALKTKAHRDVSKSTLMPGLVLLVLSISILFVTTYVSSVPDKEQIEQIFTPPVFVYYGATNTYSQPILLMLGYGACALLFSLAVVISTLNLNYSSLKYLINTLSATLCSVALMVLFFMNHCYDDAKISGEGIIGTQLNFLGKLLIWHHEVPEVMIPLFDENLKQVIIDAKKTHNQEQVENKDN